MLLFHVSEEPDIPRFYPRLPARRDLDPTVGLVWALDEEHLPNFLTPRECPRVAYRMDAHTTPEDAQRFFSPGSRHVVVIEHDWFPTMLHTVLYLYAFQPEGFSLQDATAGYYVSTTAQTPLSCTAIPDIFQAQFQRKVELRLVDNLWETADAVRHSTLQWSLCRMRSAKPRP